MFRWEKSWRTRAVAAVVTAALLGGVGVSAANAAPARTATAVNAAVAGQASLQGSASGLAVRVGSALAAGHAATGVVGVGATTAAKKKPGPSQILKYILKHLKKGASWVKQQVKRGYMWFDKYIWKKLPKWVRVLIGWTGYETWSKLYDYLF